MEVAFLNNSPNLKTISTVPWNPRAVCSPSRGRYHTVRCATIDANSWDAAAKTLRTVGLEEDEELSKLLSRAFGWTSQAYWRREKVKENPDPESVERALEFLRNEVGFDDAEVANVLRGFPEAMALSVDERMRENIRLLRENLKMDEKRIRKAVLGQPQILGYTLDCGGDCQGECARCWVRF